MAARLLGITAMLGAVAGCAPAALHLESLSLSASSVGGGGGLTAIVTLSRPTKSGGARVTLSSSKASAVVPASITVPEGESTATFTVTTGTVAADESVFIKATYANDFRAARFTITATPPPAPALASLTVSAATVQGGTNATGTVTLTSPALAGGATASLASSSTSAVVPEGVTVEAGNTAATFAVTTAVVVVDTSATITATLAGTSQTALITITAGPPPAPTLASVTLSPATVPGGTSATGTVTLTGPAQGGGATIALASNRAFAVVPASVTVMAGSSTASFTVTTSAVGVDQTATITADFGGRTRTASLLVTVTGGCALSAPGAQWLAFSSRVDDTFAILAMRDDGTCRTQLTDNSSTCLYPSWSPQGKVAFRSGEADGSRIQVRDFNTGIETAVSVEGLIPDAPSFSPDGRFIAFDGYVLGVSGQGDIYVVPEAGGVPSRLTSGVGVNFGPAWSPDGSEVYFVSNRTGRYDVWKVPAAGGTETQVTVSSGILGRPAISPRGDSLAYTRAAGGGALSEVVVQPLPTGTVRVVSNLADQEPTFDRTGDRMVVTSFRPLDPLGNAELWLLDVATGAPVRQLTFDPGVDGLAAYAPFP